MEKIELKIEERQKIGTSESKRLRSKGLIPSVIYGVKDKPVHSVVDEKELKNILKKGGHPIITLKVGDKEKSAIIQEVQRHPVSSNILHVDFHSISMKEKIEVKVPLVVKGEPIGVKSGGILSFLLREIPVRCFPGAMPHHIEIDVSSLNIGDSIHIKDITVDKEVEILLSKEEAVITVTPPTTEKEKEPAAEEVPSQPEVIGEKEREERKAAAAADKEKPKDAKPKETKQ